MPLVKVSEAVTLTGKSRSAIYRLIDNGSVRPIDSTDGMLLDLDKLNRAIAATPRGRPKGSGKHS